MLFGLCCSPRSVADDCDSVDVAVKKLKEFLQNSNADFAEFGVNHVQVEGDESEWHSLRDALHQNDLQIPTWNCFIPAHHRLTGDSIDHDRVLELCKVVLERVRDVGGEVVVLGSGGARRVDEGFSPEVAREQFISFCQKLGPIAQNAHITMAIEPLNSREDNLLNTVEQGTQLVDEIAHPGI